MTRLNIATFRASFASCEIALLVDLSTRTVLAADSALRVGQEYLDTLCATACALFTTDATLPPASAIIQASPSGLRFFLRSPCDPAEALCAIFGATDDLTGIEAAARPVFEPDEAVAMEG